VICVPEDVRRGNDKGRVERDGEGRVGKKGGERKGRMSKAVRCNRQTDGQSVPQTGTIVQVVIMTQHDTTRHNTLSRR
jgi:hypothetical protein